MLNVPNEVEGLIYLYALEGDQFFQLDPKSTLTKCVLVGLTSKTYFSLSDFNASRVDFGPLKKRNIIQSSS